MFPLLSLITFLPLLGGIVILFLPKERLNLIRWTALSVAWIDLLIVLGLMLAYSQANLACRIHNRWLKSNQYLLRKCQ